AAAAGGVATVSAYSTALHKARAAIDPSLSTLIDTRFSRLEYANRGEGMPLLMVYGTGGGFDQGLLFVRPPLLDKGYRIISPSRFGYLRSLPSHPGRCFCRLAGSSGD
ncbi:MAG: hypothetical protein MO852_06450, partial [Candidatus Devosia euplotis]|nr:hypothetical protein [Candidatus Devosia euplotis]